MHKRKHRNTLVTEANIKIPMLTRLLDGAEGMIRSEVLAQTPMLTGYGPMFKKGEFEENVAKVLNR